MFGWLRAFTIYCGSIVLVGAVAFMIWSRYGGEFPLRHIEIQSTPHVDELEIRAIAEPFCQHGFFGLNVGALQQQIRQVPWIRSATVRRRWPDKVVISIKEQIAQGKWGQSGVLNTDGQIFYPNVRSIPNDIPEFLGDKNQAKEILGQYLESLEVLAPLGLSIKRIQLSHYGVWNIVLDNNVRLVLSQAGFRDALSRFILVYPNKLQAQSHRIAYIDLRYTNGFAIGWREPEVSH